MSRQYDADEDTQPHGIRQETCAGRSVVFTVVMLDAGYRSAGMNPQWLSARGAGVERLDLCQETGVRVPRRMLHAVMISTDKPRCRPMALVKTGGRRLLLGSCRDLCARPRPTSLEFDTPLTSVRNRPDRIMRSRGGRGVRVELV